MKKNILFITGTRADYGKLKSLIKTVENDPGFETYIFATGMHTLSKYGYTVEEIQKEKFKNLYTYMNQMQDEPMDNILANTIAGLARYVREFMPDMIVVHGDRIETLAGAIVGSLNNILVAHVEGGEISGTIDELIRHSVSKLSHLHFVANESAAQRLIQMGELKTSVYVIGSPDIDLMLSSKLPTLNEVKKRYDIFFDKYSVVLFHPVTTEISDLENQSNELANALIESNEQFIIIYPNNDLGNQYIFNSYMKFQGNNNFKMQQSFRFEYFLTLLKNANYIIGNSSAGIREAPVYGIPTINIGTRQLNRYNYSSILNAIPKKEDILKKIRMAKNLIGKVEKSMHFGQGDSAERFLKIIKTTELWATSHQKKFCDL